MATINSTEYAAVVGGASQSYAPLKPYQLEGRIRIAWFTVVSENPTNINNGDTLNLVKLPDGARVIRGRAMQNGLGTSVTLSIGDSGSATRYKAATAAATTGEFDFASTVAENAGHVISGSGQQVVTATVGGANWSASKTLTGYVMYVID